VSTTITAAQVKELRIERRIALVIAK